MPRITFISDDTSIEVAEGENLLRAAMLADVAVRASCGGDGTCGKCRMVVESGSVATRASSKLSADDRDRGYVLGCMATVTEDVVVRIPAESRPGAAPVRGRGRRVPNRVLSVEDRAERVPVTKGAPPLSKRLVAMTAPNLSDNRSDTTRLTHALEREHELPHAMMTLDAIRDLPAAARDGDFAVTATVWSTSRHAAVLRVEPGDTTARQYALAVDVGTTTVEVALVDLIAGRVLAQAAEYNAQVSRGEDVISRVIAASKPEGLTDLEDLVVRTISKLATQVCAKAGVHPEELLAYIAAGNTVMTHLLLGVSPASIRTAPYVPAASSFPRASARDVGLPAGDRTQLIALPCPASWLGGDIVAGVTAAGIPWSDKLTLFIDVGTNGEIVLGNREWLVSCSCSAGPAFEGGGISHGMRAAEGAIEQVRIDPLTLAPSILTICCERPLGICGSGLIDCISELFLAGALERSGKFKTDIDSPYLRHGERGLEYVVVSPEDSGTGSAIVLTEADIENLMRAKAAIFAGISVLVESLDLSLSDIEEVVVAGGFGHYLDLERITVLGMVPEVDPERFVFLGNGSLLGAELVARSTEMLETARRVAEMTTYLELSVNAGFMDSYVSALFLPHTDLGIFPRTEAILAEKARERTAGAVS